MSIVLDDFLLGGELTAIEVDELELIIAAVASLIRIVPGIGRVFEFEPYLKSVENLRAYFGVLVPHTVNYRINGWSVTRSKTVEKRLVQDSNERLYVLMIQGYYGLADYGQTARRFQNLIERLCNVFRTSDRYMLQGLYPIENVPSGQLIEYLDPPQVDDVSYRVVCQTLCHYVRITLVAHGRKDW